jgi:hypothetical protein
VERLEGFTIAYEYSMNNEKVQDAELEMDTLVQQQNAFEDEVKEKETERFLSLNRQRNGFFSL